jgi:phenylacetate-CoA ligase
VPNDQQVDFMRRIGASYAALPGPKRAHALALQVERAGIPLSLGAVMTSGEQVTEADREACRRVFGTDILDLYGSKEGNHMAYRCPSQTCWHVNAETLLLEIVDDDGRPCRPGEMGRVIITPFFSTAQPLIRYDHGDLAIAGETCVCGRTLPVLAEFVGRIAHMFTHPDGRALSRSLPDEYREHLKSGPWQIAQTGAREFEIRYVPLDWAVVGDEASVADAFRQFFFADARVNFRRVAAIAPIASGKYIEYLNEFNNRPMPSSNLAAGSGP